MNINKKVRIHYNKSTKYFNAMYFVDSDTEDKELLICTPKDCEAKYMSYELYKKYQEFQKKSEIILNTIDTITFDKNNSNIITSLTYKHTPTKQTLQNTIDENLLKSKKLTIKEGDICFVISQKDTPEAYKIFVDNIKSSETTDEKESLNNIKQFFHITEKGTYTIDMLCYFWKILFKQYKDFSVNRKKKFEILKQKLKNCKTQVDIDNFYNKEDIKFEQYQNGILDVEAIVLELKNNITDLNKIAQEQFKTTLTNNSGKIIKFESL